MLVVRGVACAIIGAGSKIMPLPSVHVHGACIGTILFVYELHVCLHVLCACMYTSHIIP